MKTKIDFKELREKAIEMFGEGDYKLFFAPSRVNIIGEHIDYNGGKVLPGALEIGTYAYVKKSSQPVLRLKSLNASKYKEVLIDSDYNEDNQWLNYPLGMLKFIKERGYKVGGLEGIIAGNIPTGSGLSSSASLEVLIGYITSYFYNDLKIDLKEIALIGQETENKFIGVNSGIMDQFASAMGKKNKAILLDTKTLEYEYKNIELGDYLFVIMNTNKPRKLSDSKYNERRRECEEALALIRDKFKVENLCDLETKDLDKALDLIKKENIKKRLRHVVTENERVKEAVKAMEEGRLKDLGQLLNQSDKSLKEDYEVTGEHLDSLTESARKAGALGARMTGAGFGGCALALVEKEKLKKFKEVTARLYKEVTGIETEFYESEISDGPREVSL